MNRRTLLHGEPLGTFAVGQVMLDEDGKRTTRIVAVRAGEIDVEDIAEVTSANS